MKSSVLLFLSQPLLSVAVTRAFWRMEMGAFDGAYRMDPIMSAGAVSRHAHVFHGSAGVGLTADYNSLQGACTTAAVLEDKSAYWINPLTFVHADGRVERVKEKFNRQTVYYFSYDESTQAFPEGFHMVVGNPHRRSFAEPVISRAWSYPIANATAQEQRAKRSIGFLCIEYQDLDTLQRQEMYSRAEMDKCTGGFQANIVTPGCWNGKIPESNGDMSHLAYSSRILDGICPDTHNIRIPTLLFETNYEIGKFIGVPGRYVFGTGDEQGYGYHADFKSGWPRAKLQEGLNTCLYTDGVIDKCRAFTLNKNVDDCHLKPPPEVVADREICDNSLCNADDAAAPPPPPPPVPVANTQQRIAVGRQQNAEAAPAPEPAPPQVTVVVEETEVVLPPTLVTKILTVTEFMTFETTEMFTVEATPAPSPLRRRDDARHVHRRRHAHGH